MSADAQIKNIKRNFRVIIKEDKIHLLRRRFFFSWKVIWQINVQVCDPVLGPGWKHNFAKLMDTLLLESNDKKTCDLKELKRLCTFDIKEV